MAIPERRIMEILFKSLQEGQRYYTVRLNGNDLFMGSKGECERFLELHRQKVAEQHDLERKPRRNRPVSVRTYRQARTTA